MSEENMKKLRSTEEEADLISNLPDVLLISIISLLPDMEPVKTSVLSHRWKTLWKYSSHLGFDQIKMLKPLIEVYFGTYHPEKRLAKALLRKMIPEYDQAFVQTSMMIKTIIDNHISPLTSCTICHLAESCASGDVVGWMQKLLEKGVTKVSMELESPDYLNQIKQIRLRRATRNLDLPYDLFSNFEDLKLKNYCFTTTPSSNPHKVLKTLTLNNVSVGSKNLQMILSHTFSLENLTLEHCNFFGDGIKIDSLSLKYFKICDMNVHNILVSASNIEVIEIESIICNPEDLVFETPKLHVLRTYNDVKIPRRCLTARNIIEICGGILVCGTWFYFSILRFFNHLLIMYHGGYTAEVTNLSPRATENDVHNFFGYCGVIEHVDVIRFVIYKV